MLAPLYLTGWMEKERGLGKRAQVKEVKKEWFDDIKQFSRFLVLGAVGCAAR